MTNDNHQSPWTKDQTSSKAEATIFLTLHFKVKVEEFHLLVTPTNQMTADKSTKRSLCITFPVLLALPILTTMAMNYIYPTPPGDHGKGTMFDLIANRYDFINRALALNLDTGWRRVMVKEVTKDGDLFDWNNQSKKVHILDLATGTADVAILIAKEYQKLTSPAKSLKILGVDPSQNMINVGKEKVAKNLLSHQITLEIGDARKLSDIDNDIFDAATMSFGIRNVPEKNDAFCEIHRVLKKEDEENKIKAGKLAILEFSEPGPEAGIMGYGARFFIRYVVPMLGAILSGAPREYMHLQNSIKEFPSPKQFVALMESIECSHEGTFKVENVTHLNFGSVQLYLATPIFPDQEPEKSDEVDVDN